jgi:VanZ family protein
VQKTRNFAWYWLPLILWMILIFGFSSDSASVQHSSRILEPLLRFLFPGMAEDTRKEIVFIARKCAHLTEYAVLALLVWRLRRKPARRDPRPWSWREAGVALLVAAAYAATDEYHQTFVPGREGCVRDVIIDSCGAAAGLFLLWLLGRWRRHW